MILLHTGTLILVKRAVDLFDKVVVTVAINPSKKPLFTTEERVEMLKDSLKEFDGKVDSRFI